MSESVPIRIYDEIAGTSLTDVFEHIDRIAKNLKHIQRLTVSEAGLTPPQFYVLRQLWEQDGRPFKELAAALACTPATITGIIDTLENKGLVTRVPNPADRRSLLATLTIEGRDLQHETPSLENIFSSCCEGLAPHEVQQLGFLLNKLNDSMNV